MLKSAFQNQSFLNFSVEKERKNMKDALQSVRSNWGRIYSTKDASLLKARPANALDSLNPSHLHDVIGTVQLATKEEALAALKWVHDGSKTWKFAPVQKRIELLEKMASWMLSRRYELSALMVHEVGKNWREADADVCEAIDFCRYYAREMNRLADPRVTQQVEGEQDLLTYHPKGVSVVIAPWNFPLAILCGMTMASLVTGNTVIIKPSEQSMVVAAEMVRGMVEVGFPKESFYFLPGVGEEIGPVLVEDPRVDIIVFTGSAEVGLSIIQSAAQKPKPGQRGVKKVIAEMGGKNALIVDEDADLDEAIKASLHSAFGFQGQKCSALSRLLVHEKVYESFVPRLVEAARGYTIGSAESPDYQMGPVVDADSQKRILNMIQMAKSKSKLLLESKSVPDNGTYVPLAIFEVEDTQDDIFQKEIFGPVLAIKKIKSFDEGLQLANAVPYALTGGVFTRSPSNIEKAKKEFEVGNLYINRSITGALVERHPFGGFKLSGVGSKAGGPDYLLQFLEPRSIAENTVRRGFAG